MTRPKDGHGQRVRLSPGETFPERFGRALVARSMTLSSLQRRLGAHGHRVALSSLSAWRSGDRRPESPASLDAVAEIESILDLPPGHLSGARGPSRRPGPRPPETPIHDLVPVSVPIRDALRRLGLHDWEEWLVEEVVHVAVDLDGSGSMARATVRALLRGLRSGACAYPVYAFADQALPEPLEVVVLAGARVGGAEVDMSVGLGAWRLELPRPLEVGETAWVEYVLHLVDVGEPDTHALQHVTRRLNELTVWARFDPGRLPRRCFLVVEGQEGLAGADRRVPVDVSVTHAAHVTLRGFGPGRAGIAFDW